MLTCPLLAVFHSVHAPPMLPAMRPLTLIRLPAGKQVGPIAMRHIRVTLPKVPIPIRKAVCAEAMPETPAILPSIVAVVCALLHAQPLSNTHGPLAFVVVTVVVLAHSETMPAALLEVASVGGALLEGLTA